MLFNNIIDTTLIDTDVFDSSIISLEVAKTLAVLVRENTIREVVYIDWHPFTMNLLYTADHASESAMHFLMAFPEFSSINRWTYPNPKL